MTAMSFISASVSFISYNSSVIVRMLTISHFRLILVLWCLSLSESRAPEKSILKKTQGEKSDKRVSFDPDVRVGIIPAKEVADQFEPVISIFDVERAPLKPPAEIKQPPPQPVLHRPSRISSIFQTPSYISREETYTVEEVQSRFGLGALTVDSRERIASYKRHTFGSIEMSLSREIDEYGEPTIFSVEDDVFAPVETPETDMSYLESQLLSNRRVYNW
ncbi:hypothetical protein TTRE_0000025701 [Trichuris trichiura]|uniref:Uncharacterized protein n=1 Tax=Trichuris trichiura TaxID=36087 RepID=A0A077YWZ4_TRITR|nr:hypothetical protein TTRE_0000025701 [Trichuris trichiura]